MASDISFLDATVLRRSTITLKKESTILYSRIVEIVQHAVKHSPSTFHVQSCRAVILLYREHEKLWDISYEHNKKNSPPPIFERLRPNLEAYKASYGTVRKFWGNKLIE
jgi:predicted oxidoreductase (fatty acid repression mutant protein)